MAVERIWLDVPFAEKDEAKAAGARWDPAARRWYSPRRGIAGLERWAARADVPRLLPGEDRSLGSGLFVDLVPSSCWFTNVRSCVAPQDWDRLRRMIYARAQNRCEACGAGQDREAQRRLEAHERWTYDRAHQVQTLKRLICLCTDCHTVTHFGLAQVRGLAPQARAHLIKVTGLTPDQADRHIAEAFELWQARSRTTWTLDLSILTDAGITLAPPPDAAIRADLARDTLRAEAGGVPRQFECEGRTGARRSQ
ncbi:DUF5710 domain-containing protein [Kitasatospora griseola]|uniref:DUF5710 domain-containing protein n=1 Tax=Kitasatospora griseola TaxID=2064 RepID=UPI0005C61D9B|nr:DUF5710 domain-containing protein [Kitasatospora griseola]